MNHLASCSSLLWSKEDVHALATSSGSRAKPQSEQAIGSMGERNTRGKELHAKKGWHRMRIITIWQTCIYIYNILMSYDSMTLYNHMKWIHYELFECGNRLIFTHGCNWISHLPIALLLLPHVDRVASFLKPGRAGLEGKGPRWSSIL